jgi:uncharacterized protein YdgA (DUF945 family)
VNRTAKILLAIGGIAVLSYPGIAWVTGIAIEGRIQHSEQQGLDKVPYLTLVKREYHRGVYRSTEITTYGWRNPAQQAVQATGGSALPPSGTITIASNIQHGPFPGLHAVALAVVDSTIIAPPALQQLLSGALGSKPILQVHSTVGLFGGATANLTSPAFSLRLPDGSTLAWGGLTGTATSTRNEARWSGQLSAPRLALQGPQGGFELAGIEYSGAHEKAFDALYVGTGTFTIERLDGSSPRAGDFSLQRISVTSTSKADGEFFDLRIDAAMDAAKIAAVQLKNVMYSESFEHVHGPSLAAMLQALRAARRQAGGNRAQFQAAMQDAFRHYGVDLLLHDPVIDIRQVSFAMPEGNFLLSARISAPGLSRADLKPPATILALKNHAEVTADLKVDNGLVQKLLTMAGSNPKVAAQLTSLEQAGFLTAGPGAVTTHLEYSGGRLTLNSHPFPPAPPVN